MRNLSVLTVSQAIFFSYPSLFILVGGTIGAKLAPHPSLIILPTALFFLGMGTFATPSASWMRRYGRKVGFMSSALIGVVTLMATVLALKIESFLGFCVSGYILGGTISFVQHYRFAVIESVSETKKNLALSILLFGSTISAVLGPFTATTFQWTLPNISFGGSFMVMGVLSCLALVLLMGYTNTPTQPQSNKATPLMAIIKRPIFYKAVIMGGLCLTLLSGLQAIIPTLITAAGFSLSNAALVMQLQVMMMFLPSMISGYLLNKLGTRPVLILGSLGFTLTVIILSMPPTLTLFIYAGLSLGISWNLCFLGATTLVSESYTEEDKFKAQALNEGLIYGVQAVFPLAVGPLYFIWGWWAVVAILVPALVVMIVAGATRVKPD